jgi:mono/diheme cytochrome c family protein
MTRLGRLMPLIALGLMGPGQAWAQGAAPRMNAQEYEGWRQYSVHCARCHGQDVLGNPVAADLLKSAAPGGPMAEQRAFVAVVKAGRPNRGMPGLGKVLTDEQVAAIYTYVKGRADKKLPAGRPERPKG